MRMLSGIGFDIMWISPGRCKYQYRLMVEDDRANWWFGIQWGVRKANETNGQLGGCRSWNPYFKIRLLGLEFACGFELADWKSYWIWRNSLEK